MFRFFGGYPDAVSIRLVGVATARLPTPACVMRTCRAFHPFGPDGFGPHPAGGFAVFLVHCAPALSRTAPPICTAKHFPLAHIRELALASMR